MSICTIILCFVSKCNPHVAGFCLLKSKAPGRAADGGASPSVVTGSPTCETVHHIVGGFMSTLVPAVRALMCLIMPLMCRMVSVPVPGMCRLMCPAVMLFVLFLVDTDSFSRTDMPGRECTSEDGNK